MKPGDDLESDRYLITVEEVQVAGSIALPQDVVKEAPDSNSRRCLPSGRTLGCRPAGLKQYKFIILGSVGHRYDMDLIGLKSM